MTGQDQAGQHPAEAVSTGHARHLAEDPATGLEGLHRHFRVTVPAVEAAAVVAFAVALHIAHPEVELFGQALEHRFVRAGAEAIAVDEVQQGFAGRLAVPAAQGEAGGTCMGPGQQVHRFSPFWPRSVAIRSDGGPARRAVPGAKKSRWRYSGRRKTSIRSNRESAS
ncbi:hypothetical protein D9M71_712360 [compost metagenome]